MLEPCYYDNTLWHLLVLEASGSSVSGELREPVSSYSEIQLNAPLS